MYDVNVTTLSLTSDEVEILETLLSKCIEGCVSIGEELTYKNLLEKLR